MTKSKDVKASQNESESKSAEINEKYYKQLVILRDPNNSNLLKALDIAKKYLMRESVSCIITGGYAIHLALKLKGTYLYEDYILPDYDFLSSKHYLHAYEIGIWLNRTGLQDLSIINAMHPTTMKVRLATQEVVDSTFMPENILQNIPTLNAMGFQIVHPHFQMIDMHRALSLPYENPPWETINHRWKKDMERYDLLYEYYPICELGKMTEIKIDKPRKISIDNLKEQCISGFVGLIYWVQFAKKLGFKSDLSNLGEIEITKNDLTIQIPIDSHGITLYTNDINKLYTQIKKSSNSDNDRYKPIKNSLDKDYRKLNNYSDNDRFYKRFGDKLPRKIIIENEWELLDNINQYLAAHKTQYGFHVANLQNIMLYLLTNYILIQKIKGIPRGNSFYVGYLIARELVKFGSDKEIKELLPTSEYYGITNNSDSYLHAKYLFYLKNNPKYEKKSKYPMQPHNAYDSDMRYKKIPKAYYDFDPNNSELFQIGGEQCEKFL